MTQKKTFSKKFIFFAIAIAVALCGIIMFTIITLGGSTGKKLAEQLALGEKYFSELEFEQAIVAYQTAITIDPKCEEAYLALAQIYQWMGDHEAALAVLEEGYEHTGSEEIKTRLDNYISIKITGWELYTDGYNYSWPDLQDPTEIHSFSPSHGTGIFGTFEYSRELTETELDHLGHGRTLYDLDGKVVGDDGENIIASVAWAEGFFAVEFPDNFPSGTYVYELHISTDRQLVKDSITITLP